MSGVAIVGELMAKSAALVTVVPLAQQFGGGVPQKTPMPNLLATRISRTARQPLAGPASRSSERVQVTVRAASYQDQVDILKLVIGALDGATGAVLGLANVAVTSAGGGPDFRDDAASIWMGSEDFLVSFPTT